MFKQIKLYVKSCQICQQVKASRVKPSGFYQYKNILELPLRRYEMDLMGPFPRSKRGNKYIITMICQFSRFMIMAPIPHGNSQDVAKFLIDRVILKYGNPVEIFSDNGTHFTSGVIKDLMKLLQIDHKFGTIYNFRSIASCERSHDIINTKLRAFITEKCDEWDAYLSFFEFAMNSSYSTAIGTTPFKLLYGFDPLVPSQLAYSIHKYDFVASVESRWNAVRELAQETLLKNQIMNAKHMNKNRRQPKFKIGDEVMCIRWSRKKNIPHKLCPIFQGPLIIVDQCKIIPVNFLVESKCMSRTRKFWVHCDKLKHYIKRDERMFESSSDEESDDGIENLDSAKDIDNSGITNGSDSSDDDESSPRMPILHKQITQQKEDLIDFGNEVNSISSQKKIDDKAKLTLPKQGIKDQSTVELGQSSSKPEVEHSKKSKKVSFSKNIQTTEYIDTELIQPRHNYFLRSSKL
jgi:hypothetical protein